MLSFTVLRGGVGARHPEMSAMSEEERAGARVIKLAAIIALNCLDGGAILSGHMNKEVSQMKRPLMREDLNVIQISVPGG